MPHDPFYWSAKWRRCRAAFLAAHPVCQHPRCAQPATHVDHRTPRHAGGASFAPHNLQSLCPSHHSMKTAMRDGGFGNPVRRVGKGCDAAGNPTDPAHTWNAAAVPA